MGIVPVHEQLISQLNDLNDEQVTALLEFLKVIHPNEPHRDYDEANDPLLNGELSFSGSPDLAEHEPYFDD